MDLKEAVKKKRTVAVIPRDRCVACGVCAKVCPRNAIEIVKGCYAQVDQSKCVGCNLCAKHCPADIIGKEVREHE